MERVFGRIFAGEQKVEQGTEAIDIGAGRCLSTAILFGRSKAGRAELQGVLCATGFEITSNAKIDQRELSLRVAHHVARFEITKDDWRLAMMQVVEHLTQL